MERMTPELGIKVAACFRHFRSMKSELTTAQEKVAAADKENAELKGELEAYQALVDGILDGTIDPDDCEEKLAELREGQATKVAAAVSDSSVRLGQVDDESVADTSDLDPLTKYLLETQHN
jgi:hypothetical protein